MPSNEAQRRKANMPVRLDRNSTDFAQRFADFLAMKREVSADTSRFIARKSANRWAKSVLFLSSRTGMLAFRRWASLEGILLNGAATNRRQPFATAEGEAGSSRRVGKGVFAPSPPSG